MLYRRHELQAPAAQVLYRINQPVHGLRSQGRIHAHKGNEPVRVERRQGGQIFVGHHLHPIVGAHVHTDDAGLVHPGCVHIRDDIVNAAAGEQLGEHRRCQLDSCRVPGRPHLPLDPLLQAWRNGRLLAEGVNMHINDHDNLPGTRGVAAGKRKRSTPWA